MYNKREGSPVFRRNRRALRRSGSHDDAYNVQKLLELELDL